ncbi:MAG: phosphomannomutase [Kiritimatiellia bacterium]|jgi:phosphomannomutase
MSDIDALLTLARAWMQSDPDPTTREAVQRLIDAADLTDLSEHFDSRLQFGTAGLRGALGPGPNRMNRANVRHVTAGLADYLLRTVPNARESGVVIGFDGRHLSLEFAHDAACILADRGFRVWIYDVVVPTPRLAHAVSWLKACGGIMVTASHNPARDNGYKVYWGNGAQIIAPHDTGISAAIDGLSPFDPRPLGELAAHRDQGLVMQPPGELTEHYYERIASLRVHPTGPLCVVYSAMHGVGTASVLRALGDAGYDSVHPVPEQRDPDPDFPTVAFPNPEEPGALDLSFALADEVDADIIVANDPDADRLAVAVRDASGAWRKLTGNQVGVLLAHDLLVHGDHGDSQPMVATTVVSTRMLKAIAVDLGADFQQTLTGFKWIANAAMDHEARGGCFVFGFEEALGYSAGDVVRDKDGVSAVLLLCDLAAWCLSHGFTLLDHLTELYRRYGLHVSIQRSVVLPGAEGSVQIERAMHQLRTSPPTHLGGSRVIRLEDLSTGRGISAGTDRVDVIDLPRSNVIIWEMEDGGRAVARPSGTEPKIKFYGEAKVPLGESVADAELAANLRVRELVDELLQLSGLP